MADTIKAPQTGRQLDADLAAIAKVLEDAPDQDGMILYIFRGEIAYDTESNLFDVTPLT